MSLKFSSANVIYIKNLSPLVHEVDVKEMFKNCDEILKISFSNFPGTTQRYCQIEFSTSAGVTNASGLNGNPLRGLPMTISVIDPVGPSLAGGAAGSTAASETSTTATGVLPSLMSLVGGVCTPGQGASSASSKSSPPPQNSLLELAMQSHFMNLQAVQSAAVQAQLLAEKKRNERGMALANLNGVSGGQPGVDGIRDSYQETEQQQIARTIYIDDIPADYTEEDVRSLFYGIGAVTDIRIDVLDDGKRTRFALVEFANHIIAETASKLDGLEISGRKLRISESKTTVRSREPENVKFDFAAALPTIPVAYQQLQRIRIEEKLAKVKAVEESIIKNLEKEKFPREERSENSKSGEDRYQRRTQRSRSSSSSAASSIDYRRSKRTATSRHHAHTHTSSGGRNHAPSSSRRRDHSSISNQYRRSSRSRDKSLEKRASASVSSADSDGKKEEICMHSVRGEGASHHRSSRIRGESRERSVGRGREGGGSTVSRRRNRTHSRSIERKPYSDASSRHRAAMERTPWWVREENKMRERHLHRISRGETYRSRDSRSHRRDKRRPSLEYERHSSYPRRSQDSPVPVRRKETSKRRRERSASGESAPSQRSSPERSLSPNKDSSRLR